jgi:hypothetical protein
MSGHGLFRSVLSVEPPIPGDALSDGPAASPECGAHFTSPMLWIFVDRAASSFGSPRSRARRIVLHCNPAATADHGRDAYGELRIDSI